MIITSLTFNKDPWLHCSIDAISRISQFTTVPTLPSPPYTVSLQTAGQAFHKKNTKKARNYFHNFTCLRKEVITLLCEIHTQHDNSDGGTCD